jgi:hypothetical protein
MMELSRRQRVFLSAASGGDHLHVLAMQPARPRTVIERQNRRNKRFDQPEFALRMREFWSAAA